MKIVNLIIIFQFVFVFHIQAVQAMDVGNKLEESVHKDINKMICSNGGGSSLGGQIGCTGVSMVTSDPGFLKEMVNMLLIITLTLSLVNSKCKVTDAAKKLKPKSYTAGITHWIHKLASLIYIYAELQNILTLDKLSTEHAERARDEGQEAQLRALREIQEDKRDAMEKKFQIMEIATLGLGASAAVELGMTAAYSGWGAISKAFEASRCAKSNISVANCAVPGTAVAQEIARAEFSMGGVVKTCTNRFKSIDITGSLVKQAKSKVLGTITGAVGSAVGGALGAQVSQGLGGGNAATIAGGATGAVVGARAGQYIGQLVTEATKKVANNSSTLSNLNDRSNGSEGTLVSSLTEQPKKCIQDEFKGYLNQEMAEAMGFAVAVDSCVATAGTSCGPAIAAHCTAQKILNNKDCVCALRNTKMLAATLEKIKGNLDLPDEIINSEVFLTSLARSIANDERVSVMGVEKWKDVCGVDYSNWGIRHDLECKSVFNSDEKEEKKNQEEAEELEENKDQASETQGDKDSDPKAASTEEEVDQGSEIDEDSSSEKKSVYQDTAGSPFSEQDNPNGANEFNLDNEPTPEDVRGYNEKGYAVFKNADGTYTAKYRPETAMYGAEAVDAERVRRREEPIQGNSNVIIPPKENNPEAEITEEPSQVSTDQPDSKSETSSDNSEPQTDSGSKPGSSLTPDYRYETSSVNDKVCVSKINNITNVVEKTDCSPVTIKSNADRGNVQEDDMQRRIDQGGQAISAVCGANGGRIVNGEVKCYYFNAEEKERELNRRKEERERAETLADLEEQAERQRNSLGTGETQEQRDILRRMDQRGQVITSVCGARGGEMINDSIRCYESRQQDEENDRSDNSQREDKPVQRQIYPGSGLDINTPNLESKIQQYCRKKYKGKPSNIIQMCIIRERSLIIETSGVLNFDKDKIIDRIGFDDAMDIHIGLKSGNPEQWVELFFNDSDLMEEYNNYNYEQKKKTHEALIYLSKALVMLQESFISSAHAKDQFTSSSQERSVLLGLGLPAIALVFFPKVMKKTLKMSTVLQRTPIRRGIFYLLTYMLAKGNTEDAEKKIEEIEKNIEALDQYMKDQGMDNKGESSFFNIPFKKIENNFSLIPEAFANDIDNNLIPLCVENGGFSTKCTCRSTKSCGNDVVNGSFDSPLFRINALKKTFGAQLSFAQKMSQGRVNKGDYQGLKNTLEAISVDIDPMIAAGNLSRSLQKAGLKNANIEKRAEALLNSLQTETLRTIANESGGKIKMANISSDLFKRKLKPRKRKKVKEMVAAVAPKEAPKKAEEKKQVARVESDKAEESLDDFKVQVEDINQNKDLDLFKIITNRYQSAVVEERI